jgi:hypothetical protein
MTLSRYNKVFNCWTALNNVLWLTDKSLMNLSRISFTKVKVKVKVTLRLAVYRQSVRLGGKPLETHNQTFFFQLNSWTIVLMKHPLWWEMGLSLMNMLGLSSSVHFTRIACYWKCLPFALHTSPLSVRALQSRSCLSYISYATMAA